MLAGIGFLVRRTHGGEKERGICQSGLKIDLLSMRMHKRTPKNIDYNENLNTLKQNRTT